MAAPVWIGAVFPNLNSVIVLRAGTALKVAVNSLVPVENVLIPGSVKRMDAVDAVWKTWTVLRPSAVWMVAVLIP